MPSGFDVRYWTPGEMLARFNRNLGPSHLEIAGFFSQGQPTDLHLFSPRHRLIVQVSERLKRLSRHLPFLTWVADNLLVVSTPESWVPGTVTPA